MRLSTHYLVMYVCMYVSMYVCTYTSFRNGRLWGVLLFTRQLALVASFWNWTFQRVVSLQFVRQLQVNEKCDQHLVSLSPEDNYCGKSDGNSQRVGGWGDIFFPRARKAVHLPTQTILSLRPFYWQRWKCMILLLQLDNVKLLVSCVHFFFEFAGPVF